MTTMKRVLVALTLAGAALSFSGAAHADPWPEHVFFYSLGDDVSSLR